MLLNKINLEGLANKLLYMFAQKSRIFKYFLMSLVSILLFVSWLFLFAWPLGAQSVIARNKIKQLNSIKNSCSKSYAHCADLSKKIASLRLKTNKRMKIMGDSSAYISLGKVIEYLNSNELILLDCSPGKLEKIKVVKREKDFAHLPELQAGKKVNFELSLEGSYLNMLSFFKCLSAIKYCLKYNQLSLYKNDQGLITCKLSLDILQISK